MSALAALQLVLLSRCPALQGLGPGFPGRFVARRSRAVGLSRCCAAQRPGAQHRFISFQSRLGAVTEGSFCSWSVVPSRAVQASAL